MAAFDWEHALAVARHFLTEDDEAYTVALLHDAIEDGVTTVEKLRKDGMSEEVITALEAISRRENEVYADYIERVATNPLARRVKLADLEENLKRCPESLRKRYEKAQERLRD